MTSWRAGGVLPVAPDKPTWNCSTTPRFKAASRKILLLGLIVPVIGVAADLIPRPSRAIAAVFALAAGLASIWALASVLWQQEGSAPYVAAAGVAVFGFVLTALVLALRDDGLRTGAAGLGLGLATGVAAVLSASIGFLLAGIAVAAAAGALARVEVERLAGA